MIEAWRFQRLTGNVRGAAVDGLEHGASFTNVGRAGQAHRAADLGGHVADNVTVQVQRHNHICQKKKKRKKERKKQKKKKKNKEEEEEEEEEKEKEEEERRRKKEKEEERKKKQVEGGRSYN